MIENRINYASFDLIKGIGILMVILTHTLAHLNWETSYILRFFRLIIRVIGPGAIPAFFMISGWGAKKKSPKKLLKKSAKDLLIPYVCIMAAYGILVPFTYWPAYNFSFEVSASIAARYVVAFLFGFGPNFTTVFGFETLWCTAAWYFLAMFIALNLLNLILHIKNTALQICCVVICPILGAILFSLNFVFYCLPQGLMAVGYCYIGHLLKRRDAFSYLHGRNYIWVLIVLIPAWIMEVIFGYFDLCQGLFRNVFLDYIGVGCCGMLAIIIGVNVGNFDFKPLDIIKKIGVYSYWIFIIHSIEMEVIPWYYLLNPTMPEYQGLAFFIEGSFKVAIIITGCSILKKITQMRFQKKMILSEQ